MRRLFDLSPTKVSALALLVALCSIVYELIFSQTLTVFYGQTVLRYSLTIGLYLFSMGIGAFLYSRISGRDSRRIFYGVEVTLSLLGPLGVFFIFAINSLTLDALLSPSGQSFLIVASHVPIIAVGILSGLEIPLLVSFYPSEAHGFYRILGWDYFGSLIGTLVYALWLYPDHGLVTAVLATGFLNALAAVWFFCGQWWLRRVSVALNVIALAAYLGLLLASGAVADLVTKAYLAANIEHAAWGRGVPIDSVEVVEQFTTPYQQVVYYRLHWPTFAEDCLNLDSHVQMCQRWVVAYHYGITHVPLAFFDAARQLDILIVGGGDFIIHHYLAPHLHRIHHVDHVDVDAKFMAWAKSGPLLPAYNHGAPTDVTKFTTMVRDGFSYLRTTKKKYDLILLDLPGLMHDKLLPLHSVEFFTFLRRALKPNSLVTTWTYGANEPQYMRILEKTLATAGFRWMFPYRGYTRVENRIVTADPFLAIARDEPLTLDTSRNAYVAAFAEQLTAERWQRLVRHEEVRPNSILAPNLDMLIPQHKAPRPVL